MCEYVRKCPFLSGIPKLQVNKNWSAMCNTRTIHPLSITAHPLQGCRGVKPIQTKVAHTPHRLPVCHRANIHIQYKQPKTQILTWRQFGLKYQDPEFCFSVIYLDCSKLCKDLINASAKHFSLFSVRSLRLLLLRGSRGGGT